ncbi:MAG: hypothetical protein QXF06_01230 [Archaeoglobaceae archaeon]
MQIEKRAVGLNTFFSLCERCKFKTDNCTKNIDLCILSEICFYLRKIAILLEHIQKKLDDSL